MDWYVPAYIALVIASIGTISLPVHLSSYRERGVLRRFRASGVSEASLLGSQLLVSLGVALIGALIITVLGRARVRRAVPASAAAGGARLRGRRVLLLGHRRAARLAGARPRAPRSRSACCSGSCMLFVSGTSAPLDRLPTGW